VEPTVQHPRVLRFGSFQVDLSSGELEKHGIRIRLQDQPFQILVMLLERPGEVVTREALRQKLWPADTFVDFDKGLNSAVLRLRGVLSDSAEKPRYIETLPRRGYRFIAEVKDSASSSLSSSFINPSAPNELPVAAVPAMVELPGAAWRRRPARLWLAAAALGLAVAIFLAFSLIRRRHPFAIGASPRIQSIAVLPLENLTGDPNQEYFVDGMTDALITDLAQIRALRVISRTSVMQYKRSGKLLPQIARELKVDAVLEGSVVRSKDQVRIDAQLIQTANDQHLWAKSYQRELRDIVVMQNEIAHAVADEVRIQLTPQEQVRLAVSNPVNSNAYENYLKGQYYLQRWASEGEAKASEYFQKATKEDPNYAPAYAGLALAYARQSFLELPTRQVMPLAEQAARRALALDDSWAEAHEALAFIKYRFYWDWAGAEAEFNRALELSPNYAEGHREYAVFLRTANRYQESVAEAVRAKELDPKSDVVRAGLGNAYLLARQYNLAIQVLRQAVAQYPEGPLAYVHLGLAYEQKGLGLEAISALEECVRLSHRDPTYLATLAHAYATFGRRQDAEKILAELQQRAKRQYVSPSTIAEVWLGLGNKRQALAWLEKAYEDRAFQLVTINSFPSYDPVRSDPRFQSLVRRIGLDPRRAIPN
jgi:TolB-like protein/DNA-binding winged helix-turn-helix (wHTH) protein/Tfp pilus assembly protein PilF